MLFSGTIIPDMEDIRKQVEAIEEEIRKTPYHKGTEHHIGWLRARVARLKDRLIEGQAKKGGGGSGFAVKKFGDATVVLVGFPSVGKSTLLNKLTNAKSPVAEYAFTTVSVIPGMMKYKGADIQILDVPGLIEGASLGRGRGREVLSVVRSADLLLLIAEARKIEQFNRLKSELYLNGVRVNEELPEVVVKKTLSGGLHINSKLKQELDLETIKEVVKVLGLINAEIVIRERLSLERLVDAFAKNRVFVPALYVLNKIDLARDRVKDKQSLSLRDREEIAVSAEKELGLDELREAIREKLGLVRVYLRRPGQGVDFKEPVIVRVGDDLGDVARKVGGEFAEGKKFAKIWGPGARFPGQTVSLSTEVKDEIEVMFV